MTDTSIKSADLSWEPAEKYPDGTLRKVLRTNSQGQPLTMLLKLPPGFVADEHSHVLAEHHYVLEGEYKVKGEIFSTGHYHFIPEHTNHGPFESLNGAQLLIVWES